MDAQQQLQTQLQTHRSHAEYYQDGMTLADHYASKGEWGRVTEIIKKLTQQEREWLAFTLRVQELARRSVSLIRK